MQPSKLPDGLLEVRLLGRKAPIYFILEISSYADRRVHEQVIHDMTLVYLDRGELPEVLTVVLRLKGKIQVEESIDQRSPLGWTRWHSSWRVVELWNVAADYLLALDDPGLIPWVPLNNFEGPPEPIFQKCRDQIDLHASPDEHDNLLAVTQVLSRLRYESSGLLTILGGRDAMIESPLIQELQAEAIQRTILSILADRFGNVSGSLPSSLAQIRDENTLHELAKTAGRCEDLSAFEQGLDALRSK